MRPIVITGYPGSGKSAVLDFFKHANIPYISVDNIVRDGYKPGNFIYNYLLQRLGRVDKNEVVDLMFNDDQFKTSFEGYVYPFLFYDVYKFCDDNKLGSCDYCVIELPLYYEVKIKYNFSIADVVVIGLYTNEDIRFSRVKESRNWSREYFDKITSWHFPYDEKFGKCDFIVNNNGSLDELYNQCDVIFNTLKEKDGR